MQPLTLTATAHERAEHAESRGLPIVVIGAGPVGVAAAAHLLERDLDPLVLEAGDHAGASIAAWGHVRLFTPWRLLVDDAALRLLERTGWTTPEPEQSPTGRELLDSYLIPLASHPALASRIRYGHAVTAVSRLGMDRTRSTQRAERPFVLRASTADGVSEVLAAAVIDTSGTWTNPNPLLASGLNPTTDVRDLLAPALPDIAGADRNRFAARHTLVVGAGHSAANTLLTLAKLDEPGTRISWALRNSSAVRILTADADGLPERAGLGRHIDDLVRSGRIELIDHLEIDDITRFDDHARVFGRRAGDPFTIDVDQVVVATGFRPDLEMLREIRLALDDVVEAPRALAPLIDPNLHSCGSVPPHGVAELTHPEPNFFIAGMKAYGRAPTFLLATGYEQVRSIADELAGNHAAAREVKLVLPETGVCSTTVPAESSCSSTDAPIIHGSVCCPPVDTLSR